MHRHALPRLPDVSAGLRHSFSRQKSTLPKAPWFSEDGEKPFSKRRPSEGANSFSKRDKDGSFSKRDCAGTFSKRPREGVQSYSKRPQGGWETYSQRPESSGPKKVAKALQSVLSPQACAQLEGKPPGLAKKSKQVPLPPQNTMPPSMEKLAFEAQDPLTDTVSLPEADDQDAFGEVDQRFAAGSFLEIRRNGLREFGVVLYTVLLDRKWTVHSLTARGELWPHQEHDVQFQIPNFVDKQLAEDCGMTLIPESEKEMDSRVQVLKRMRSFERSFENTMHEVLEHARTIKFYDQVAHPDSKTWAQITIYDAAEKLFGSRDVSLEQLLAAQTYLMEESTSYVVEQRRFLAKQTFWVRPREDVEVIKAVHQMSLENDPALNAFAEKARTLVSASRVRAAESFREPPSRHPLEGVELTEKDKTILRYLRLSLRTTRRIQTDPFSIPFSQILKKTGLYDLEIYDESSVYMLLSEMGVLAPWQEVVTREEARFEELEPVSLRPTNASPMLPDPLGPQDFYRRDLVDSLRHDFGNTPVYVIDDWGAEELDDGVSIERIPSEPDNVWLHIHVADPTTLLPPTHEISRNAFRLSTSSYLLDRTIRMLPPDAGFHQFSLGQEPGQPDKVMTFSVKVNSRGEIADYKVRAAVVNNVRTLKYDMVDVALGTVVNKMTYPFNAVAPNRPSVDSSAIDSAALEDLRLLQQTVRKLVRARVRNGAITMCLPMIELELNPRPLPDDILGSSELIPSAFRGFPDILYGIVDTRETGARELVSESMKTACRVASLFFRDRGIPALRRSVGAMRSERVGGVEEILKARAEDGFIDDYYSTIRNLVSAPPGRYLTTPGPHALLGVPEGEGYVKVTSPLRRFGDLFAHWQIKHALLAAAGDKASPVLYPEDWLSRFGEELETREFDAKRTERIQLEYWAHLHIQRWLSDPAAAERQGPDPLQHLTARLMTTPNLNTRTRDNNAQVYIPELGMKSVLVDLPQELDIGLGDEVNVKIKMVKLGMRPMIEVALR
ncbi:Mitochondrial protein cyt-4 [Trametes pubescens]|uniref:Mitochondrial protein cyt-4 n=1 Tax=Trametes pubescens TaxID=154538 RepID=A0A1M2V7W2_TRAPU|nr:Mitochondrial protein cyt-4 [Trametes pubescens]